MSKRTKIAISVKNKPLDLLAEILIWLVSKPRRRLLETEQVSEIYVVDWKDATLPSLLGEELDAINDLSTSHSNIFSADEVQSTVQDTIKEIVRRHTSLSLSDFDNDHIYLIDNMSNVQDNDVYVLNFDDLESEMKKNKPTADDYKRSAFDKVVDYVNRALSKKIAPEFSHLSNQMKQTELNIRVDFATTFEKAFRKFSTIDQKLDKADARMASMDEKLDRLLNKK